MAVILVACSSDTDAVAMGPFSTIAGGDIRATLNEDGNARITGADVSLTGRVGGELRVTGADIALRDIEIGTLSATGADVVVAGNVEGDASVTGADIRINGDIGGNLRVRGADIAFSGGLTGDFDGNFADGSFSGQLAGFTANGADIRFSDDTVISGPVRVNAAELMSGAQHHGDVYANVRHARLSGSVEGQIDIYADEGDRRRYRDTDGLVEVTGDIAGGTICARRVVISGTVSGPLSVRALETVTVEPGGSAPQLDFTLRGETRCRR